MQTRRIVLALALVLLVLVLAAAAAAAAPPAGERCRATKLLATGAHALALLRCHASAIAKESPAKLACLAAADAKLARAFARAERRAACSPALPAARAQAYAFVTGLLASAQPTPPPTATATPAPTATPSSTGCGNGVVEGTEHCDGQPYCDTSCALRTPTVCCGPVGACIQGPFPDLADICGGQGIPYVVGGLCEPTEPSCDPTAGCAGQCVPEATFAPTDVCCEMSPGCTEATVDDTIELWAFFFQQCLLANGTAVRVGTCGPAGDCLPGG